jgi:TolA-binding protein
MKKLLLIQMSLFVGIFLVLSVNSLAKSSQELLAEAVQCIEAQDNGRAMELINQLISEYPDSPEAPEAHLKKAYLFIRGKDKDAALQEFESLAQEFPDTSEAAEAGLRAGNLRLAKEEFSLAESHYRTLLAKSPASSVASEAWLQLGKCVEQKDELVEAFDYYKKVITDFPPAGRTFEAQARLSEVYLRLWETDREEALSLKSDPSNSDIIPAAIYVDAEASYYKRSDYERADNLFAHIYEYFPQFSRADDSLMMRGRCAIKMGQLDQALEHFRAILRDHAGTNHCNEAQAEVLRILWVKKAEPEAIAEEAKKLAGFPHDGGRFHAVQIYRSMVERNNLPKQGLIDLLQKILNEFPNDKNLAYYKSLLSTLQKN